MLSFRYSYQEEASREAQTSKYFNVVDGRETIGIIMFFIIPPGVRSFLRGDVLLWRRREVCVLTSVRGHLRSLEQPFSHPRDGERIRFTPTLYILDHIAMDKKS